MIAATLLVVAKSPVAGLAKTRLTPPLTPRAAAQIAAAALLDTLAAATACAVERRVVALTGVLADAERTADLSTALENFDVIPQRGADFAERLANAHADCAELTGLPVLQVGMDTPQADSALLSDCAELLVGRGGAVLGPAGDGGWWALGLSDPSAARTLTSVPMSTDRTGEATLDALADAGVAVTALPMLDDVDHASDAVAVARHPHCGNNFRDAVANFADVLVAGSAS